VTIYDYIKKHKLKHFAKWPATNQEIHHLLIEPQGDVFDLYRNSNSTHFVSINRTKGRFRIFHSELVPHFSEWCSTDLDNGSDIH